MQDNSHSSIHLLCPQQKREVYTLLPQTIGKFAPSVMELAKEGKNHEKKHNDGIKKNSWDMKKMEAHDRNQFDQKDI